MVYNPSSFLGFHATTADPSLFVWHYGHHLIILLLYVDDIFITGSNSSAVQRLINKLAKAFATKDLISCIFNFNHQNINMKKQCIVLF